MAKGRATQVVQAELADEDVAKIDAVTAAVEAVEDAVEANHDGGVDELLAGSLTLDGTAQALVAQATPCRGVLLRAPASDDLADSGTNTAPFFAGPSSYPSAIRVPADETKGLYIAVNDAAKLKVKGTLNDKAKYVIFAL